MQTIDQLNEYKFIAWAKEPKNLERINAAARRVAVENNTTFSNALDMVWKDEKEAFLDELEGE